MYFLEKDKGRDNSKMLLSLPLHGMCFKISSRINVTERLHFNYKLLKILNNNY